MMTYETTAEEQRNVIEPTVALQEKCPQMMSDETTAERCVHVLQPTIALQEECPFEHHLTSFSDDENGNTDSFLVECSLAHETGNNTNIWFDMCTMS